MAGTTGRFRIEDGAFGVRLVPTTNALTSDCLSAAEIDANIRALQADLEFFGQEMKRINKKRSPEII